MKRYARSDAAERAVLGSMIRDNAVIGRVLQIVRDSHFRCDAHQRVFRAVVALFQDGKPIDLETLANRLYAAGDIEHIGGYGLLGQLWEAAPSAANAEHYAQTVREAAIVRQLGYVAAEIASTCEKPNDSADRLLSDAIRKLEDLAGNATQGSLIDARRLMAMAADAIDRRATGQTPESLPTGLPALDEFDVMRSGELVIIGARPSCGKTALLLAIMRHVAVAEGLPVFFASLEQSAEEIADRLLAAQSGINGHRLRRGRLQGDEVEKLCRSMALIDGSGIWLDDAAGQTVLRIAANARYLSMRHGVRAIFVDYLQLIEPENRRPPRHEQLAAMSRRLKCLARELRIPVVAAAQLNRQSESHPKPRLSDLRESGALEADADVVLLLDAPQDRPDELDVIIAKNRNGPRGETTLRFDRPTFRFSTTAPAINGFCKGNHG